MYELGMPTKGKCDTFNNEYKVVNCKKYHLSYTHLLGYNNCYYEYNTQTKASLNATAYKTPTSDWYK
jgi:hypothetical protein